jgi:hypothetical protein
MAWYWWLVIGWILSAILGMALQIRDNPRLRENISMDDAWPMAFGPVFLMVKLWHAFVNWGTR